MINFSAIAPHLQVHIAEKMTYFDQMELESSSKCGEQIVNSTKFKAIIDVLAIQLPRSGDVYFYIRNKNADFYKKWTNISRLCCFKVSCLNIMCDKLLNFIFELAENAQLVNTNLELVCYISLSTQMFTKLAEVLNITEINGSNLNDDLFYLPSFANVKFFSARIDDTPVESLLELKSKHIVFYCCSEPIANIANPFLHQWFQKERDIDLFRIEQSKECTAAKESVVNRLPVTIIWQYEKEPTVKVTFLKEDFPHHRLIKCDVIYSVDRGDKKLLIIPSDRILISFEYNELADAIRFDTIS